MLFRKHIKNTTMNKIYFRPDGGLGNRMRSLLSAYQYCEKNSIKLIVIWLLDNGFNCKFEDIFLISNFPKAKFIYVKYNTINIFRNYRIIDLIIKRKCLYIEENISELSQIDEIKENNVYIHSYEPFFETNMYYLFEFVDEIKNMANCIINDYDKTIGVHIRRTDNSDAIKHSPLELFIEKIRKEINSGAKIYLATDSNEVKCSLIDSFGNDKIITNINAELNRSSKNGIINAAIDMYILSKTEKIYGSYWSSFSDVSAKINNIPLVVLNTDDVQTN